MINITWSVLWILPALMCLIGVGAAGYDVYKNVRDPESGEAWLIIVVICALLFVFAAYACFDKV